MPLTNPPGAHPDLATHDALGLATDAELTAHDHDVDYEAAGGIATHAGAADPHTGYLKESDVQGAGGASAFGDTAAAGSAGTSSRTDHRHSREANPVTAHEAAGDPHTGYRLESADHSHASAGLQGGTIAHADTSGKTANDHHNQAHVVTGADHTASGLTIGHVLTASSSTAFGFAAPAGGGAWTTIIKPADTGRTNNTVSADPDLVATLSANTNYVLRFRVFMLTNATADSRYQLTFSGTTTRVRRQIIRTATADVPAFITIGTAFDAAPVVLSTTGLNPYVEEMVILQVGASGGTFAFQWAQVTTNGSPCTVLEGSFLEYATT